MKHVFRAAAAAALLGILAGLVPASGAAAATLASPERRTWVQGDSVLLGAVEEIDASIADWQRTIGAYVGLNTRTAIQVFRDRQAELGSVVVVEVGLNDWGMNPTAFAGLIDEAMAVLAGRHVVWLTSSRFRQEMDGVNGAIRAAPARHPNLEVLEWGQFSDAHPELTYDDRIHLRPAGQQAMAAAIDGVLDRWWAGRCLAPEAEMTGSVARLYRAYFLRPPDGAGLEYWRARWRNGELCLADISEYFAGSGEFTAAYGALGVPDFVRRVYLNVLGREPDPDGYNHWATHLSYGGMRRGTMMIAFSESPEFRARSGIA